MKKLLTTAALGLALSLSMSACKRHEAPASAPVADAKPATLQKIDTVPGTGKEAVAGSTVVVHYTGWLYAPDAKLQHGAQFDSSVGGQPFSFPLGAGQVIPGWDQGVQGMKVGGKRTLIVPAALGYGERGAGPIPPNANLIFDVELLDVK
jgi:FKBP-type peptidyl-prolyl cis-trans isomerase FkpA